RSPRGPQQVPQPAARTESQQGHSGNSTPRAQPRRPRQRPEVSPAASAQSPPERAPAPPQQPRAGAPQRPPTQRPEAPPPATRRSDTPQPADAVRSAAQPPRVERDQPVRERSAQRQQPSGPIRPQRSAANTAPARDQAAAEPPPGQARQQRGDSAGPARSRRPGKPPQQQHGEMTDQMEPVDEAPQYRRRIDDTIARFSAAHDEWEEEEAKRKQRRGRITAGPARLIEQTRTRLQRIVDDDQQGTPEDSTAAPEASAEEAEPEAEADAAGTGPYRRTQGRFGRVARALRISACIVAVLVFAATATAWGAKQWFNAQFNKVAALDMNS